MRTLLALFLLAAVALSAHAAEQPMAYPLWDGEPVAEYAKKAGLEPTKTLDLGNGIKMEMVLIPAGKFVMGTPDPVPVDEVGFRQKIIVGQVALATGGGVLLVFLVVIVTRAIRQRRRPQYSLARFVAMIVAASVAVLGGVHWRESMQGFAQAKAVHQVALARHKDAKRAEKPAHEVTLTRPFYIGRCEIKQDQFQQVMEENRSRPLGPDLPVVQVSWDDAQDFCRKASVVASMALRLPTEAEWEYACRAGTQTTYNTGDQVGDLERAGWYGDDAQRIHPVGQKAPNRWGVYDMHGNVSEWCEDWFEQAKAEPQVDPRGPAKGGYRVRRGGSSGMTHIGCRSADRNALEEDARRDSIGFRVAADVPSKAP